MLVHAWSTSVLFQTSNLTIFMVVFVLGITRRKKILQLVDKERIPDTRITTLPFGALANYALLQVSDHEKYGRSLRQSLEDDLLYPKVQGRVSALDTPLPSSYLVDSGFKLFLVEIPESSLCCNSCLEQKHKR